MTTFENEIEIIEGTLDLEMARINRDYKYGLGMAVATESVCEYCMTEAADGQPGFFTRMIDAIVSFIRKINESVANLFSKQEHVDLDSFLQSQTGQVQLSYDMEAIDKEVNKKVLEGRKIIQAISSKTGVSDETVAKFCDGCANVVKDHGAFVVSAVGIGILRSKIGHKIFSGVDQKISDFRHVKTLDETMKMTRAQVEEEQMERKRAKNEAKAAKRQKQMNSVMNALGGMMNKAGSAKAKVAGEINQFCSKAASEAKKKASDAVNAGKQAAKDAYNKHKK